MNSIPVYNRHLLFDDSQTPGQGFGNKPKLLQQVRQSHSYTALQYPHGTGVCELDTTTRELFKRDREIVMASNGLRHSFATHLLEAGYEHSHGTGAFGPQ